MFQMIRLLPKLENQPYLWMMRVIQFITNSICAIPSGLDSSHATSLKQKCNLVFQLVLARTHIQYLSKLICQKYSTIVHLKHLALLTTEKTTWFLFIFLTYKNATIVIDTLLCGLHSTCQKIEKYTSLKSFHHNSSKTTILMLSTQILRRHFSDSEFKHNVSFCTWAGNDLVDYCKVELRKYGLNVRTGKNGKNISTVFTIGARDLSNYYLHTLEFVLIDGHRCVKIVTDVNPPPSTQEANNTIEWKPELSNTIRTEHEYKDLFKQQDNAHNRHKRKYAEIEPSNNNKSLCPVVSQQSNFIRGQQSNSPMGQQNNPPTDNIFTGDEVDMIEETNDETATNPSEFQIKQFDENEIILQKEPEIIINDDDNYTIRYKFKHSNNIGFSGINIVGLKMQVCFAIGKQTKQKRNYVFVPLNVPSIVRNRKFDATGLFDGSSNELSVNIQCK